MRWQCDYIDLKCRRCVASFSQRLYFSADHTFDHVDTCDVHFEEYQKFSWIQDLMSRDREIRE